MQLGPYQILRSIGKGGMGEVFLAYDPTCERELALKRIRKELAGHPILRARFLREARTTAQLTHPGIIPVYAIHQTEEDLYYTMPFVEGHSLRHLFRTIHEEVRHGKNEANHSIAALLPLFLDLCHAVAYAHSRGILHRDLKPENFLIGKYGEAVIVDWGLAQSLEEAGREEPLAEVPTEPGLTLPGKIVGTVGYMAPERAFGHPSSVRTEIYSLGVILYQILTLHHPFHRESLREFKKRAPHEKLIPPEEMAPYRDVSPRLSHAIQRCLAFRPEERYETVDALLADITPYLEGTSEWTPLGEIEWIQKGELWLSKERFVGKIRLEATLSKKNLHLFFDLSETREGYSLLLTSEKCQLLRNGSVLRTLALAEAPTSVSLERSLHHISCSLNGERLFTYTSHIPLSGEHIGCTEPPPLLRVYRAGPALHVGALALPDLLTQYGEREGALLEYRRIAQAFPGHAEGREARLRAGMALVEMGQHAAALDEFSLLHRTPSAPLEYLGKALVYRALGEETEEIKCLELALRRYKNHPLLPLVEEQLLCRLQETPPHERPMAYGLHMLVLRYLPPSYIGTSFLQPIVNQWEALPFLRQPLEIEERSRLLLALGFWLGRPHVLAELVEESPGEREALFALVELGAHALAEQLGEKGGLLKYLILSNKEPWLHGAEGLLREESGVVGVEEMYSIRYLCEAALRMGQERLLPSFVANLFERWPLSEAQKREVLDWAIWGRLLEGEWGEAERLFSHYSLEHLSGAGSLTHTLYGCFLRATEGEEIADAHFSAVSAVLFPRTHALLSHERSRKLLEEGSWLPRSFLWERRHLYRQLALYHTCAGEGWEAARYRHLERLEKYTHSN